MLSVSVPPSQPGRWRDCPSVVSAVVASVIRIMLPHRMRGYRANLLRARWLSSGSVEADGVSAD